MTDDKANNMSIDTDGCVVTTIDGFNSNGVIDKGAENEDDTGDDTSERAAKKTKLSGQYPANDKTSSAVGKQIPGKSPLSTDLTSIIQNYPNLLQDYAKFHQAYNSENYSKSSKKRKKKFIDPKILDVRRKIQFCCRDNDLSLALATFYECMMGTYYDGGKECRLREGLTAASAIGSSDANDGENDATETKGMGRVFLEAQTLYNLLNLCEGSFGEREKVGRVHVGTPKDTARKHETNCNDGTLNGKKMSDEIDQKCADRENDTTLDAGRGVSTKADDAIGEENKMKLHSKNSSPSEYQHSNTNHHSHPQPNIIQRLHHANQIYTLLSLLKIPCIEPAFTALIRLASRVGDWDKAEAYLREAEETDQCKPKLRMYSSLLKGYCEGLEVDVDDDGKYAHARNGTRVPSQEGLIKALQIWKRMYEKSGGPSTGHPQFHDISNKGANGHDNKSVNDGSSDEGRDGRGITNDIGGNKTSDAVLFGEGIAPKITLTECEYSSILECATFLHDVLVAERVLSDLMERVLIPGLTTTETILNWFRSENKRSGDRMDVSSSQSSALDHVNVPPREGGSIGQISNTNGKGWVIYHGCRIDSNSGVLALGRKEYELCNVNDQNDILGKNDEEVTFRLKPVELSNEAWEAMRRMNRSIVLEGQVEGHVSQFQGGGKGKKRPRGTNDGRAYNSNGKNSKGNDYNKSDFHGIDRKSQPNQQPRDNSWRVNEWEKFETFIKNHPPFNVVIDGANVGYFQQNFGGAPKHVDYRQIDWLVRHLLEHPSDENYHIMLFLHERHFSPKLLPKWAYSIIDMWEGNRAPYDRLTLCRTPGGMNDDWFWMQAALLRGGQKDAPSVLAITNDEMRDHHFQMLAQGSFLRWKERHQVHFDFGQYDKSVRRREVILKYPKSYSRRIQRLEGSNGSDYAIAVPLPKKGDEGRYVDGVHVADEGAPEEETYALIQWV
ncbi:hypothetical protein ACHAXS_006862 [Conticribra weissflogii]